MIAITIKTEEHRDLVEVQGSQYTLGSLSPLRLIASLCPAQEARKTLDRLGRNGKVTFEISDLESLWGMIRWPRSRWGRVDNNHSQHPSCHHPILFIPSIVENHKMHKEATKVVIENVDWFDPILKQDRIVDIWVSFPRDNPYAVQIEKILDTEARMRVMVNKIPEKSFERLLDNIREELSNRHYGTATSTPTQHPNITSQHNMSYDLNKQATYSPELKSAIALQIGEIEKQIKTLSNAGKNASPGSMTKVMMDDAVMNLRAQIKNLSSPSPYGNQSRNSDFYVSASGSKPAETVYMVIKAMEIPVETNLIQASLKWKEFSNSLGNRWTLVSNGTDLAWHIKEVSKDSKPYQLGVLLPNGDAFRYKVRFRELAEAQMVVEKSLRKSPQEIDALIDSYFEPLVPKLPRGASVSNENQDLDSKTASFHRAATDKIRKVGNDVNASIQNALEAIREVDKQGGIAIIKGQPKRVDTLAARQDLGKLATQVHDTLMTFDPEGVDTVEQTLKGIQATTTGIQKIFAIS